MSESETVEGGLPTVTEIRSRRGSKRCEVYLDGELWRSAPRSTLNAAELATGDRVEVEELSARLDALERPDARQRALRLLAYRERSAAEVAGRLVADGYQPAVASDVVDDLVATGLIDDVRFAHACARTLSSVRGFGPLRVARVLAEHQIDPATTAAALSESFPDEEGADAVRTAAQRLHRASDTPERLASRLLRRGFAPRDALDAARTACDERESV